MCKVYNPVGCLTEVKSHLSRHRVSDFKSINEVIAFQQSYEDLRRKIIAVAEIAINAEWNKIIADNELLKNEITFTENAVTASLTEEIQLLKNKLQAINVAGQDSVWRKIFTYGKALKFKCKIKSCENGLSTMVKKSVQQLIKTYQANESRAAVISSQFRDVVIQHCSEQLNEIDIKKKLVDEVSNSIYGAIGEQKVVRSLEILPDDYTLINDFRLTFQPPIYSRNENDYIRSIQIDHVLVGPPGIFIIETKNWSEQSLNNTSLRSPVQQIKRTNFALFTILNKGAKGLGLDKHHWGARKISLKNIIVFINQKPQEEFQHVKILTLSELVSYIKYFPPIYNIKETENIGAKLIKLSGN